MGVFFEIVKLSEERLDTQWSRIEGQTTCPVSCVRLSLATITAVQAALSDDSVDAHIGHLVAIQISEMVSATLNATYTISDRNKNIKGLAGLKHQQSLINQGWAHRADRFEQYQW
ncbi:hypothetical protein J6590_079795 [Homalodisca vitripennis]|nr:hypothetical protein J6590_079795 [Homalodisca vitripennis]